MGKKKATDKELAYLACPYSNDHDSVMLERTVMADRAAAWLMDSGFAVFSPVSHSHRIAKYVKTAGPKDNKFWLAQDLPVLWRSDKLFVLAIDGWTQSLGVNREIGEAKEMFIPIKLMIAKGNSYKLENYNG